MTRQVKICGLTTPEGVEAASRADFIGFVFFPGSPRNLTPQAAKELAAKSSLPTVAVTADANDMLLGMIVEHLAPSYLQLHGNETVERVEQIKNLFNIPVIKAFTVLGPSDIERAHVFEHIADMLMFDAKVQNGLPGGNGVSFDWEMLKGHTFRKPWLLSGGLTPANVVGAMRLSGAKAVDVSSGVESKPGIKNPALVNAFIEKIKGVK